MSYCRFSSDFGECDVYVYEDCGGGWTTHVASRRRKRKVPDEIKAMYPTDHDDTWAARYIAYKAAEKAWMKTLPHTDEDGFISLADSEWFDLSQFGPEAGQTFSDATQGECADRLEALRAKGFNVPQYAIDGLREEADEVQA